MKTKFTLIVLCLFISLHLNAQTDGVKMKMNGFGDIVYGLPFGKIADKDAAYRFYKYGDTYNYPHGMQKGFILHGIDLLNTIKLNENFKIQTEINLEGNRGGYGGPLELEVDRLFVDYSISENFGLQVGLVYTPIGYINRNLYSRAWLMNSVHFYQAVEANSGYIPNHFLGTTAYGSFILPGGNKVNYMLAYGMPRPAAPNAQIFDNDQKGYQTTALFEWNVPGDSDFRIGLSGFSNEIHTYHVPYYGDLVKTTEPDAIALTLQESGFNPYLLYKGKIFDLLAEYHYVEINTRNKEYSGRNSSLTALSAEIALNRKIKGKRIAPYFRYDFIIPAEKGGLYYGLREKKSHTLTRVYTPEFNAIMTGIAYDLSSYNRIKLEYVHHLKGPFQADGIFLQTAFGF